MSKLPSLGLKASGSGKGKVGQSPRSGLPTPTSSRAQSALEKSARAAGISSKVAENYATNLLQQMPGPDLEPLPLCDDDYIIGDRVWVAGTKPGQITFIGETQFAPGEWAGIVLDSAVGKNDGMVAGKRYFQCEARRGVFARLNKLSRVPINPDSDASVTPPPSAGDNKRETTPTPTPGMQAKDPSNGVVAIPASARATPKTVAGGILSRKSVAHSSTNLAKSQCGSIVDISGDGVKPSGPIIFGVGDRVLVSGTKTGILRYIGNTDFAKGEWAGVELDDPLGKNDGAVAGKRYFSCKPMFGLFAPVHKVTKAISGGPGMPLIGPGGMVVVSPRRGSVPKYGLGMSLSRERSGSQDSISSIGSSASSVSRSRDAVVNHIHRVRSGASDTPQNTKTTPRPTTLNLSATNTALQKALKEKEEHIEQLLRERDLERNELARAATQIDETENMLLSLRTEHQRIVEENEKQAVRLSDALAEAESKGKKLANALEDEKRRVEDMQFTIEEEAINKGDLEEILEKDKSQNASEMARLTELEEKMRTGKGQVEKLEKDMAMWKKCYAEEKARFKDAEETSVTYLDQIEDLTHKVSVLESQMKAMEAAREQLGSRASKSSEELTAKTDQVSQLEEQLHLAKLKIKKLEAKLAELEDKHHCSSTKFKKQQSASDDLRKKLATSDLSIKSLKAELSQLKAESSGFQRKLEAQGDKCTQLEEDKTKLGEQIVELLATSGDSSQQLTLMSEQMQEKERKIEDLQAALSDSTQKVGKLSDTIELKATETEQEIEKLLGKHKEEITSYEKRIDESQLEIESTQKKLSKLKEDFENEITELEEKKKTDIDELKKSVESKVAELNEKKTELQAFKDTIQELTTDQENLKFEKEKTEKQLKKMEADAESLKGSLSAATVKLEQMAAARDKLHKADIKEIAKLTFVLEEEKQLGKTQRETLTSDLEKRQADKVTLDVAVAKVEAVQREEHMKRERLLIEQDRLLKEREATQAKCLQHEGEISRLKDAIESTQKELSVVMTKLSEYKHPHAAVEQMKKELNLSHHRLVESENRIKALDTEKEALKTQVSKLQVVHQVKQALQVAECSLISERDTLTHGDKRKCADFTADKAPLANTLENTQLLLQQREREIEKLQNELKGIQDKNTLLVSRVASLSTTELQKQTLVQTTAESQKNANVVSNLGTHVEVALKQNKEDRSDADGQIDFLNCVIVDMQRKNEELRKRVAAMEDGDVPNGHDNGDSYIKLPLKPAPRSFCDICDRFDLHETDDCPTQAMSNSPTPTSYHNDRHEERPYCTICEVFGHWTHDCDDEQTF